MRRGISLVLLALAWLSLALPSPLDAAQIVVSATVTPTAITLGETATLTVSVNQVQEVDAPELPPLADTFDVLSQGSSSNISFINGQMSTQITYTYLLSPKRDGAVVIGPITVRVGGQAYRSAPISLAIGPGSASLGTPPNPAPSSTDTATEAYFITTDLTTTTPYLNEQLLYTFRFYTRVSVDQAVLNLPEFNHFFKEEVVPERKYYDTIGGHRYVVTEKVYALFPSKTGALTIDPARLQLSVTNSTWSGGNSLLNSRLFNLRLPQTEQKVLTSQALSLSVSPLPEPEPADFSNLVGNFSLSMTLDRAALQTQESATVTIDVRGRGNIGDAVLPDWPLPPSLKVYDDKPETTSDKTPQGIQGLKRFKRAIVPSRAGDYTLPPLTLSYFNPQTQRYETISTEPVSLAVTQNPAAPAAPALAEMPAAPAQPGSPETPQATNPQGAFGSVPITTLEVSRLPDLGTLPVWLWLLLIAAPPALFALFFGLSGIRRYRQTRAPDRRRSQALRHLRRDIKAASKDLSAASVSSTTVATAMRAVRAYFAAKLNRPDSGTALSLGDIDYILNTLPALEKAPQIRLQQSMRTLEAALYGGAPLDSSGFKSTLVALLEAMEAIDAQL